MPLRCGLAEDAGKDLNLEGVPSEWVSSRKVDVDTRRGVASSLVQHVS